MARQVKQFRFYNSGSNKNWPKNISFQNLKSGSIFQNYMPIIQLGVQSLPGTKFYINGSQTPAIIGYTGIYELNLEVMPPIVSLTFEMESLQEINRNNNAYLIVDIIYEDGVDD